MVTLSRTVPALPCSAPPRVPEPTVGGRSEDQLDDLSAIPDPSAGAGGSPRSHPPNASCPALTGALHRSVPERLDGRVDQLVIARQRFLDEPGPLVGEHFDLAGLDSVEGLLGDRFRADLGRVDPRGHVGVDEADRKSTRLN